MENVLKRLLDTELKAQAIVQNAKHECEQLIEGAKEEVKRAEQRFETRIPEIKDSFIEQAEYRALMHIDELERRYQERQDQLIKTSEHHQAQAVKEVLDLLLNIERL